MGESYVKKQVLYDSLQHRKPRYLAGTALLRPDESSFQQTSKYHGKDSRQHESHTCEQYLCRCIRTLYIPQSITYLYTRKCTSPQQTAQHGTEPHNAGLLHPFVVYLYLLHVYFSLMSFTLLSNSSRISYTLPQTSKTPLNCQRWRCFKQLRVSLFFIATSFSTCWI